MNYLSGLYVGKTIHMQTGDQWIGARFYKCTLLAGPYIKDGHRVIRGCTFDSACTYIYDGMEVSSSEWRKLLRVRERCEPFLGRHRKKA